MNRTRHAFTLALAFFVLCCTATARQTDAPRRPAGPASGPSIKLPRGQGEGLEQPAAEGAKGSATRKWEYCAVTNVYRKQTGFGSSPATFFAVVRYYPNAFEEIEGRDEDDALANAFAKLGEDGWEFVAVRQNLNLLDGSGKATHAYLFKRPK